MPDDVFDIQPKKTPQQIFAEEICKDPARRSAQPVSAVLLFASYGLFFL